MVSRPGQPRVLGLHQADRIVLILLSTVIFAITLGLIQVWLSLRTVLALTLWASAGAGGAPWALPVWWLGTIPTGWLPLALPGHEHEPPFLALSLVMIAWSARILTQSVQGLEARALDPARR
jgi:hypothetical protein